MCLLASQSEAVLRIDLPERLDDWHSGGAKDYHEMRTKQAALAERLSNGVQVLGTTYRFLGTKAEQSKRDTKTYLLACPSEAQSAGLLS